MTQPRIDVKRDFGEFGTPIAERDLEAATGGRVHLEVSSPRPHPDPELADLWWFCGYRITGLGPEPILTVVAGGDSLAALQNALVMIGSELQGIGEPLTWHGGDPQLELKRA